MDMNFDERAFQRIMAQQNYEARHRILNHQTNAIQHSTPETDVTDRIKTVQNAEQASTIVDSRDPPPTFNVPQPTAKVHFKDPDGNPSQTFTVFRNFLCYYSDFFEGAFHGSFIEGVLQELILEEINSELFGIFLNWTYTRRLLMPDCTTVPPQATLLVLWLLADRLLVPKLQNDIIRTFELQRLLGKGLGTSSYGMVWETTLEDSPLRQYLLDVWDGRQINDAKVKIPREFLIKTLNSGHTQGLLTRRLGWIDNLMVDVIHPDISVYYVKEVSLSRRRRQGMRDASEGLSNARNVQVDAGQSFAASSRSVEDSKSGERSVKKDGWERK